MGRPNLVASMVLEGLRAVCGSNLPMNRLPAAMRMFLMAPSGPVSLVVSFTAVVPHTPSPGSGMVGYWSGS